MVFVFQGMLEDKMTIQGVVEKGVITFGIMLLSGLSVWGLALTGSPEIAFTLSIVGWVFGFIFFFVMIFTGLADNPIAVLTYAALQGLFLGGTTLMFEAYYSGIAIQAFLGTTAVFGGMLIIYRTGIIPVTENFRIAIFSAMSAIFMIYMLTLILSLFGIGIPYIHSNGPIGIGFSI